MTEKNNFDDKMKSLAAGFAIPTADKDLARFSRRLRFYNFLRPRFNTFNIYTSVAVVGISVGGFFIAHKINKSNEVPLSKPVIEAPVKTEEPKSVAPCIAQPEVVKPSAPQISTKKKEKVIISDSARKENKVLADTLKITVNDTVQNKIKVLVKDTVKIKKKIRKPRE